MKSSTFKFIRNFWVTVFIVTGIVLSYLYFFSFLGPNFHVVQTGPKSIYRSAQLDKPLLLYIAKKYQLRSILNLRGNNKHKQWYQDESDVAKQHGIRVFDISMTSSALPKRTQLLTMIDVLKNAPRPLLIHCFNGSDRTGLASAIYKLLQNPNDYKSAQGQLALFPYGHMPMRGMEKMDAFINMYKQYRQSGGPNNFADWVRDDYKR